MRFVIFGKSSCVFCVRSIQLLDEKDIEYSYIDIGVEGNLHTLKTVLPEVKTVPQIYKVNALTKGIRLTYNEFLLLDPTYIGGYEGLVTYINNH